MVLLLDKNIHRHESCFHLSYMKYFIFLYLVCHHCKSLVINPTLKKKSYEVLNITWSATDMLESVGLLTDESFADERVDHQYSIASLGFEELNQGLGIISVQLWRFVLFTLSLCLKSFLHVLGPYGEQFNQQLFVSYFTSGSFSTHDPSVYVSGS